MASVLTSDLRNRLERAVVDARDIAEAGAAAALAALAVDHHEPFGHMTSTDRALRNALRARARQLGDQQDTSGRLNISHLISECAYEHWHRMLFARFLAENGLLIEPRDKVAISLAEAQELSKEAGTEVWDFVGRCAQRMLPQIFRPDDPLLRISLAREYRINLEGLLDSLPEAVFTASDAMGWVYQFWQSRKKDRVNASGVKIGADEISAVTQLFTEPYMVEFLLHNTLGAWWAGKKLSARDMENTTSEDDLRKRLALPGVTWNYLRFIRTQDGNTGCWRPAAGTFADWPATVAELKILDPCCGSGHFLVAALHHLVPIRMAEEGLSTAAAVEAVLRDNIFGLEIDERCCQLAAFALALEAWKISGWKPLPPLNIACTGIGPQCSAEQWLKLAEESGIPMPAIGGEFIKQGLLNLHELFSRASTLGSLINPANLPGHIIAADFETIQPYLKAILEAEKTDDGLRERAIAAAGMVKAAELLADDYTLVITNVPYLGRGKQDEILRKHLEVHYKEGKADLATAFALRCLDFCQSGSGILPLEVKADRTERKESASEADSAGTRSGGAICHGSVALVTPQNWLFLTTYTKLRERLLKERQWNFVARLGPGAFETIGGHVVNVSLLALTAKAPDQHHLMAGVDASAAKGCEEKAALLRGETVEATSSRLGTVGTASGQTGATAGKGSLSAVDLDTGVTGVDNDGAVIDCEKRLEAASNLGTRQDAAPTPTVIPQARHLSGACVIRLGGAVGAGRLGDYLRAWQGIVTGDDNRFLLSHWELAGRASAWSRLQRPPEATAPFCGRSEVLRWDAGEGALHVDSRAHNFPPPSVIGRSGVAVQRMGLVAATLFDGDVFNDAVAPLVPFDSKHLPAIWAFAESCGFSEAVRAVNQKVNVTPGSFHEVEFDLAYWQKVAAEKYPNGLPEPESDDPTQWLFHGFPGGNVEAASSRFAGQRQEATSTSPLQVAVARLMGYRWPAELDENMRLSTRARELVKRCDQLLQFADADGIACIPAVRGEEPAATRLLALLAACGISPEQMRELAGGVDLDQWLRESFFEQHCKLFHDRPFVWQIWDGRKRDGFQALVNYHKLCESGGKGRKLLESLAYSYLGEWISRQQDGVRRGEGGAEDRLAAALELQKQLAAILAGEPPYDIFVRWKPLSQQAIGWDPDINDGVRMNIRPFLAVDLPNGKKGAGVLRWKPNIKWDKDRGKEPQRKKEEFPWFWGWDGKAMDFMGGKLCDGNRWNNCHYSNNLKQTARDAGKESR